MLNPDHSIFKGHFPGAPITPGVCQIEIVKEVLEEILGKTLILSEAKNIKFTHTIDPRQNTLLDLELNFEEKDEGIQTKATLYTLKDVCLKFSGIFTEVSR